jgi:hypothetical protein
MNTTQEIEIFSTGMTTDLRKVIRVNRKILRPFQSLQHFDVYPDRLVPKRDWVLDTGAVANFISRFTYFDDGTGSYALWGLGLDGSNHVQLLKKPSGSFTGGWSTAVVAASSATSGNPFIFGFKGYLYFMTSFGLARYNVSTNTLTDAWQAGFTSSVMPVIHPRTGAAYFFSANSVYEVDPSGTWVGVVQTLPANMIITSASPIGNNLAIGASPLNGYDNSFVYLWDLSVTASPTSINFTESIDWGKGQLMHLTQVLGKLIGVSNEAIDHDYGINKGRVVARVYSGTVAQEANYITADALASTPIAPTYFADGDKLYFPASVPFKTDTRIGVWSIDGNGNFVIEAIGPTAEAGHRITGLYRFGKAWFLVFDDNNVYRMNDQASFTLPALLETAAYGGRFNTSQLVGATVAFEKLLAGQSVTLKYKLPEDTSWTLMGMQSTAGKRELEVLGTSLKQAPVWNEYQFRVESVGATITGLSWATEPVDTNTYG